MINHEHILCLFSVVDDLHEGAICGDNDHVSGPNFNL